jgi:hypothetical protein
MAANIIPDADYHPKDFAEKEVDEVDHGQAAQSSSSYVEDGAKLEGQPEAEPEQPPWDWNQDPQNPYNWPSGRKAMQVVIIASIAFLA